MLTQANEKNPGISYHASSVSFGLLDEPKQSITLGEIAANDLGKAKVFKKFGLDFCCGGKQTLKEACAEKGLDLALVELELETSDKNITVRQLPYGDWSLDFLCDYIVNTHHSYVLKTLPELSQYTAKVAGVHGDRHPELKRILQLVEEVNIEMAAHMIKEEKTLFPYIKQLVAATNSSLPFIAASFGTVENPIDMLEIEHELVGKNLEEIRIISHNFEIPADACTSYSLLYKMLEEFESDLHIHVHLENNILFPKALKLEKTYLS